MVCRSPTNVRYYRLISLGYWAAEAIPSWVAEQADGATAAGSNHWATGFRLETGDQGERMPPATGSQLKAARQCYGQRENG